MLTYSLDRWQTLKGFGLLGVTVLQLQLVMQGSSSWGLLNLNDFFGNRGISGMVYLEGILTIF